MRVMRSKNLSTDERNDIVQFLLRNCIAGKLLKGKITEAVAIYAVSPRTVSHLWAAAKKQQENGQVIRLTSGKVDKVSKTRIHVDLELIQSLELHKRSTIRNLADGIKVSKSAVGRWATRGLIKAHTSAIHPILTAPNKLLRPRFSIEALEFDRVHNILKFKSMHNIIHIDEKWFYITHASHRFYFTPGEAEPHRTCKSKKFITKVMFMCAVCRSIFDANGCVVVDGKIGIFPFTKQIPSVRGSKNRPKGTLETKPIQSITKEVVKTCLINQIVPAIKAKWPSTESKIIFIQQDNARPHIKDCDVDFRSVASADGFDIRLINQPPNSPDTNVNDLGWFRAIQSIQVTNKCLNVEQLVNAVISSYEELSPITLNKVFISLQACMMEIMRVKGQNCYKLPHMRKDALIRESRLPIDLEVPTELVEECIHYMLENDTSLELEQLQNRLGLVVEDWTVI